jgi:hypothetical protein
MLERDLDVIALTGNEGRNARDRAKNVEVDLLE